MLLWIPLVAVFGCLTCCCAGLLYFYFKVFLIDRNKTIKFLVPLKYLPDVVIPRHDFDEFDRRRTKREQRALKNRLAIEAIQTHARERARNKESREEDRKLLAERNERRLHRQTARETTLLTTITNSVKIPMFSSSAKVSTEFIPDLEANSGGNSDSFFSKFSKSFKSSFLGSKSNDGMNTTSSKNNLSLVDGEVVEYDDDDDDDLELGGTSTKGTPIREGSSNNFLESGSERSGSYRSRSPSGKIRFVSKDRLSRKTSRTKLIEIIAARKKVAVVEHIEIDEDILRERERVAAMAELAKQRLDARKQKKLQLRADGVPDVVAINSGPSVDKLPKGYKCSEVVPEIKAESLTAKRVMYLWDETLSNDENPRRLVGWYLGSIAGPSRMKGCNFNIKYDRAETDSIFVDGIRNVNLTLSGNNAYGRRWVILHKIDEKVSS